MKTPTHRLIALFLFAAVVPALLHAQDNENKISPVLLTDEEGKTAVGLTINLDNRYFGLKPGDSIEGEDVVLPDKEILKKAFFTAKGTVSLNPNVLPKELINLSAGYEWLRVYEGRAVFGLFDAAGFDVAAVHETNQDLDQAKTGGGVYGVASYTGAGWLYAVSLGADYIVSDSDEARKALVTDDNYWRLNGEFNLGYKFDLGEDDLYVAWDYRYFHEVEAPSVVKTGRLENYRLSNLMIKYIDTDSMDFFVSYSTGKLPFDHAADRVYKVGFDYKF